MKIAAIIIGIDGWEQYTLPLIKSLVDIDECDIFVVDNHSSQPYPYHSEMPFAAHVLRTERLCYSAAINRGKAIAGDADWYIVLSNDVLCTGPFAHLLAEQDGSDLIGPLLKNVHGFDYLEGWCVCASWKAWNAIGGWDENFIGSSWEDVAFSTDARLRGFGLLEHKALPFVHLDQRQRFTVIPDYWSTEAANIRYFNTKFAGVPV